MRLAADVRESINLTGQFAAVDEILSGRENLVLVAKLRHLDHPGLLADNVSSRDRSRQRCPAAQNAADAPICSQVIRRAMRLRFRCP